MGAAWELAQFDPADVARATKVISRYQGQRIGLADASNVVLADRHGTRTVLTLDRGHFNVLRPIRGGRFRVLP
jgi:predicted nucleic acid-binding protein